MNRRRAASRRGFTLVELLVVVAMIGVLAALALVGYRKYINSAGTAEATAVMQGIRGAEEAYKAEMLVYLGCSAALNSYYPMAVPDERKHSWINPGHADFACWRQLNVTTNGAVRFGYAVMRGEIAPMAAPVGFANPPTWPAAIAEPWYVIQAAGNRDGDGVFALFLTSSLHNEVYSENDSE
jgi:type IV pilus assembly protein PilA